MKRNNVITVLRMTVAVALWFSVTFVGGKLLAPLLEGVLPEMASIILRTMVLPYTLGLMLFCMAVIGMKKTPVTGRSEGKVSAGTIVKFFLIQTGLSFPCMVAGNIACKILGADIGGMSAEQLFGRLGFYIVLLLIFNPIFEELLFRKFVLERLTCLGTAGSVICSAVLFAIPHVFSQGFPQMLYTFALGLVWGYVTIRTGKLLPAIILHSLSNLYCAFIPSLLSLIHPMAQVPFVMLTLAVMLPSAIVLISREKIRL